MPIKQICPLCINICKNNKLINKNMKSRILLLGYHLNTIIVFINCINYQFESVLFFNIIFFVLLIFISFFMYLVHFSLIFLLLLYYIKLK